jgi:Adenylate and Guanylate cyclase catalytic domain
VAVCGLPEPNAHHAVAMAKFASACRFKFNTLVSQLVTQLGPDTRDLLLRVGLNSGPVTAGVLRGQRSRFQLFGDTVNTASRMESNGLPNRIHGSEETAKLLVEAGKGHWVLPREDLVEAKGKGTIQTYWVEQASRETGRKIEGSRNEDVVDQAALVEWTVDILCSATKRVIAHYQSHHNSKQPTADTGLSKSIRTVIDEFEDVIEFPTSEGVEFCPQQNSAELSESIKKEIWLFVEAISRAYRGMFQQN